MIQMKKVALIGYGYWGPNILRNLFDTDNCEVVYCADLSNERLNLAKKRFPSIKITTRASDVLHDPDIDGVVIATPTQTHFPLAKEALLNDKHVLIEKPMAMNTTEAKTLVDLAKKRGKIIMVDHTFLFNNAVLKIKELIDKGELGKILYIDCVRANLGLFYPDVNVVFDLSSHDFSIINFLLDSSPLTIQAIGKSHFNQQEDVAYITAEYPSEIMAHVHVSWLSPLKIRRMIIIGTKKMVVYDDTLPSEKVQVYDKGVIMDASKELEQQIKIGYRTGDVWLPKINIIEPLSLVMKTFIEGFSNNTKDLKSSGKFVYLVMKVLEAATKSIREEEKITLNDD